MSKGNKEIKISHYLRKLCQIQNQIELIHEFDVINEYLDSVKDIHSPYKKEEVKNKQ